MGNSITDTNAAWNKTPFLVKERESLGTKPLGPCPLWVNVLVRVRNRVESPVVRHPFSRTLRLNVGARVHFRFQEYPAATNVFWTQPSNCKRLQECAIAGITYYQIPE
jgi:hypothetical protein